jgi:hypothetical protein
MKNERIDTLAATPLPVTWAWIHILVLVAAAILVGCASAPPASDEALARAEAGIEDARQAGATEFAAAELESANDRLGMARAAANKNEHQVAERYAEEAALDAELASAKARSVKADAAAAEVASGIETLRNEINRHQAEQGDQQ